jgi:hypothetical protein
VDVTHPFEQLGLLLTPYRFVSVLKQHIVPPVATVELLRIAGQKPAHQLADGHSSRFQNFTDFWFHAL